MGLDTSPKKTSLGLALSGGGHRATAFSLGVLLYLVDAGINAHITAISSVSGGSLLNSYVALLDKPFNQLTAAEFDERAAVLAQRISGNPRWWWAVISLTILGFASAVALIFSRSVSPYVPLTAFIAFMLPCAWLGMRSGGSVWGWWGTWIYFGLLMAILLLGLQLIVSHTGMGWLITSVGIVLLFILVGWILSQRHIVTGLAFGKTMCPKTHHRPMSVTERCGSTRLEDIASEVRHILCATEMHAGQHAYFSHDLVYSRGFGVGRPGSLPVWTAVQSSANFPGGFPLRVLRTKRFAFELTDRRDVNWLSQFSYDGTDPPPKWMVLSDGGVFDNLADAWFLEGQDRASRLQGELDKRLRAKARERDIKRGGRGSDADADNNPAFRKSFYRKHRDLVDRIESMRNMPDCLIVVNAGTSLPWSAVRRVGIPLIGEAFGFVKIADVMYRNTTSARVRDLSVRFAARMPLGAVVDMSDDPNSLVDSLLYRHPEESKNVSDERRARESRVSKLLLNAQDLDERLERKLQLKAVSAAVPTTLQPLGVATTASLLYHGYVQAMLTLHLLLDCPLLDPRLDPEPFVCVARGERRRLLPNPSLGYQDLSAQVDILKAKRSIDEARRAFSVGQYKKAKSHAQVARNYVWSHAEEKTIQATAIELLGHAALLDQLPGVARRCYEQALQIYRSLGDSIGEANTLRGLGDLEVRQSTSDVAREHYDRALRLHSSGSDKLGEARTIKSLGDLEAAENNFPAAIQQYNAALNRYIEIGDNFGQAVTDQARGLTLQRANKPADALKSFQRALRIYREIGDEERASALSKMLDDIKILSESS